MQDTTFVSVNRPIKWYNKVVKIDFKKLFIALTKSVLMFKFKTPVDGFKELTDEVLRKLLRTTPALG
jgi:hypothetical protein